MAKKMRKLLALCVVLAICIGLMTVPAFAKNDKGNTGSGQTQVHIHLEDSIGSNKDSVTIIVDGKEYHGSIQGSKLEIEMDTTDNGFDFAKGESMDVEFKNNSDGTGGILNITHQEGNGNNIGKEHDEGLNNFRGSLKEEENPTEPPATEPPATEPPATEPPATEPPATEPPATEPPATEPPATEPPATEPPATEPPATEPPATEPPATEPPATEPPATEPPATEPPATEPPATEPPVVPNNPPVVPNNPPVAPNPPAPQPEPAPAPAPQVAMATGDGLVTIFDEGVPLADVPTTGDISLLWVALSSLSAGGLILLNRKKED